MIKDENIIHREMYKNYACYIKMFHGDRWNFQWLCGYVELPENHPLYDVEDEFADDRIYDLAVHGGITYAHNHTLGFDCNHVHDNIFLCNKEYVIDELHELVDQLIIMEGVR